MKPEAAMRLALAQARRARGRSHPNPPVGAVLYRGDRVLGRGYTRPVGGAHAEVVAVEAARRRFGAAALRGASMAVTLEPCSHQGRTAPCLELLLGLSLRRLLVGHLDPHFRAGYAVRRLRARGVDVQVGVLEPACREQHRGFLSVLEKGRPFVQLKLASSLDGRIATAAGESRWITGPEARAEVHRLRRFVDGILVGSETALRDDPVLTARRGRKVVHRPVRVLVDSRLRVPVAARLYRGKEEPSWVLCAPGAASARRRARLALGARLLEVPVRGSFLDLRRGLRRLAREGLTEVLVEGGGGLAAALLRAGLVDELHWFTAPRLLGGDGRPALDALGLASLARSPQLQNLRVRRLGRDVYVSGALGARR